MKDNEDTVGRAAHIDLHEIDTKEQAVNFLRGEFLKHYEKFLEFGYLHVSLEQHRDTKEGLHRIVCEMKLSSQRGIFYASHEGWGPMQAMKNTSIAIEHQLQKAKDG